MPARIATVTTSAYPTWVWTTNDPTPAASGIAHRSPHAIDHVANSSRRKGSTVTYGFHGSRRNCAPSVRMRSRTKTAVSNRSGNPPRRRAISVMPSTAAR